MFFMKYTRHIIAISLSGLMLLTSVGYSIDMHYCQGKLKSFSVFGKAKSCHSLTKTKVYCPHHQKMMVDNKACDLDKKNCCSNKTLHFQLDQLQKVHSLDYSLSQQMTPLALAKNVVNWASTDFRISQLPSVCYKPPLIVKDQIVLKQSFIL